MGLTEFSWQNAKGLKIFAREWRPEGEPRGVIALVHGLGEHIGRYQHVAEFLNAGGYDVIGFDIPGHGKSEGVRGHAAFDEILDDIDHLLREASQRCPGKPCFLYGHSMGGALALYYSLKRKPDLAGVVVTSPGLSTGEPVPGWKLTLAKVMARVSPSFTMVNGLDVNNISHDQNVIAAYRSDPLVHPRISARLGLDLLTLGSWMQAHAAEFPTPLLLMQGGGDHIVSLQATEAFSRAVPPEKITFKLWDNLYHETHNEPEKQQVMQFMRDWLDQHSR